MKHKDKPMTRGGVEQVRGCPTLPNKCAKEKSKKTKVAKSNMRHVMGLNWLVGNQPSPTSLQRKNRSN